MAALNTRIGKPNYIESVPLGDDPVKNREMLLSGKYRKLDTQEHGQAPSAPSMLDLVNEEEIILVRKV